MAKDLRYYLKYDTNGKKVMAELGVSAAKLDEALGKVRKNTSATHASMLNLASATVVFDGLQSSVSALYSATKSLTDAYEVQAEAERKLETVMRQRMKATEEEIQGIKDLTSAQQQIGIIGDEVQLAGAQQLATFLSQTETLRELIPAMNDLVAQQKGYKASGTDAVSVANLMGKAMQGQASALRRVGITFTEAQQAMLENGNESERAAMLAQIITDNVGHMNAELAAMPTGKLKQFENTLGDIKESMGSFITGVMPVLTFANQTVLACTNMMKLTTAVRGTIAAIQKFEVAQKLSAASSRVMAAATFAAEAASRALRITYVSLTRTLQAVGVSAQIASVAIRGLMIATGVGAAIAALTTIFYAYKKSVDSASKSNTDFTKSVDVMREYYNFKEPKSDDPDADIAELEARLEKAKAEARRISSRTYSNKPIRNSDKRVIGSEASFAQSAYDAQIEIIKQTEHALNNARKRKLAKEKEAAEEIKKIQASANVNIKTEEFDTSGPAENFTKLGQFTQKIKELNESRANANSQEVVEIDKQIERIKKLQSLFERGLSHFEIENIGYEQRGNLAKLELPENLRDGSTVDIPVKIDVSHISEPLKEMEDAVRKSAEEMNRSIGDSFMGAWSGIKGLDGGIDSMTEAITGNGTAWERMSGFIDGAIQSMQAVQAVIQAVMVISAAYQAVKKAENQTEKENANVKLQSAAAGFLEAHSWIPFVGIALGVAAVAAMAVSMASVPKYAKGGIAYGPTLGMFGEYAGAQNNPEVVAPLSDLKKYISPSNGLSGDVRFRIEGTDLVGVLERRRKFTNRI